LNAFDVCSEADECSCRHRAWLYSNVHPDSAFGWRHVSGVSEGCTIMHCEVGFAASIVIDVATKNKNEKSEEGRETQTQASLDKAWEPGDLEKINCPQCPFASLTFEGAHSVSLLGVKRTCRFALHMS